MLRPDEELDFFCECDEPSCNERVSLTRAEYDRLPATSFLVAPWHVDRPTGDVPSTLPVYGLLRDAPA